MKLFNVKLTTLKSKLYAIVIASLVVRVVAFFALPDTASNLGPDEGNYGALAEWIAQGKPADEYPSYSFLYIISRTLIIPASILHNSLDINGLNAVRIVSSLYGFLTLCLAVYLITRTINLREDFSKWVSNNQPMVLLLFMVFTFMPSHLIWSILGLRDAAMEFWVLVIFVFIFNIFEVNLNPSKLWFIGILVGIPLVFSSRPQVGWVLGITLLVFSLTKSKSRAAKILIPLTIIGIFSGHYLTTQSTTTQSTTTQSTTTQSTTTQSTTTQSTTTQSTTTLSPLASLINQADSIPNRHRVNKIDAASAIKTLACPITKESRFQKYLCAAYRAPYTTYTFLVRPMLGADVTSTQSLFAAVENVFWLGAFLFIILMFIRNRRLAFFGALAPSLLFFVIYSLTAGAYEGNMGTAFRHKSFLLWVVILLLASTIVATQQRKAEQQGISGSSQE